MAQAHAAQGGRDRLKLRALALAAAAAQGCVSAPPEVRHPAELGAIAVVAGTKQPEVSFHGFPRGKAEGAALGAGQAFLACASVPAAGCSGDVMCGVVLTFWMGVCGAGTVAGAAVGAAASPSAQAARASESAMAGALDPKAIQETLREQVMAAFSAGGSRPAEPKRADTLAEVSLLSAGLDSQLQLAMHATVRLVRRADGAELSSTEYVHTGAKHTLAAWSENGAARLLDGLKTGYEALGAHIHDSVFLLHPFPDREWRPDGIFVTAYGLAPLEPELISPRLTLVRVRGPQPTLRWQPFRAKPTSPRRRKSWRGCATCATTW